MIATTTNAGATAAMRVLADNGLSAGKPVVIAGDERARNSVLDLLAHDLNTTPVNLNIALTEAMMESDQKPDLADIIAGIDPGGGPMLIDRLHVLMLPQLQVSAVGVLCRISRRRPLCVSWPGHLQDGRLKYAHVDHPEFLDEDASRVVVIDLMTSEGSKL
jgi:hypothetical protein